MSSNPLLTITIPKTMTDFKNILDTINLNDVADEPEMLAEGEYHVRLMEPQVKETKAKDGFYISYYVVVQSGEQTGRRAYSIWSLKKEALWKMKKDFKAMQYQCADGHPRCEELEGFEGVVRVKHRVRKDTGETALDLSWVSPIN